VKHHTAIPESVKVVHAPTLQGTPRMAGTYWIGGIDEGVGFCLKVKPNWLHRVTMRLVFGWEWADSSAPHRGKP